MDSFFPYIIKSNITLSVLFLLYWLFLRDETWHTFNRIFIYLIALCALSFPILDIPTPVVLTEISVKYLALEQYIADQPTLSTQIDQSLSLSTKSQFEPLTSSAFLSVSYFSGVIFMLFLSMRRLRLIGKLIYHNKYEKLGKLKIILPKMAIPPFSFFNYVVINKDNYRHNDFQQILEHERIHYKQGHTLDLLFFEFMRSIFWFNPVIYLLIGSLRIVHEFLADEGVVNDGFDKKSYQLLILNQLISQSEFTLTNAFTFSQAKRRVFMLNKERSTNFRIVRFLIILPMIFLLLCLLNIPSTASKVLPIKDADPQFVFPIKKGTVTQGYGMGINPFTQKEVFHKGIDIAAPQGTKVYASEDGIVVLADSLKGHGNKIIIQHSAGFSTHYSHLYNILVSENKSIKSGTLIGLAGNTGLSTGPHLHFEIRKDGKAADPSEYLDFSIFDSK